MLPVEMKFNIINKTIENIQMPYYRTLNFGALKLKYIFKDTKNRCPDCPVIGHLTVINQNS